MPVLDSGIGSVLMTHERLRTRPDIRPAALARSPDTRFSGFGGAASHDAFCAAAPRPCTERSFANTMIRWAALYFGWQADSTSRS